MVISSGSPFLRKREKGSRVLRRASIGNKWQNDKGLFLRLRCRLVKLAAQLLGDLALVVGIFFGGFFGFVWADRLTAFGGLWVGCCSATFLFAIIRSLRSLPLAFFQRADAASGHLGSFFRREYPSAHFCALRPLQGE